MGCITKLFKTEGGVECAIGGLKKEVYTGLQNVTSTGTFGLMD